MNKKQIIGMIGAVILIIGVFAPIVSAPILGNMNYFQNGKGDGTLILILAFLSILFVVVQAYKGLLFAGFGSIAVMGFTFINFQSKMNDLKSNMQSDLADNPFKGLADVAVQSIQLQWGWGLLIVGSILLIVASLMSDKNEYTTYQTISTLQKIKTTIDDISVDNEQKKCPSCAEKIKGSLS